MHRIDQMVAEVLLTLKRHHVEEEGMDAKLAEEAEAEVKKLRAGGMDERKAIRRVQATFPSAALGRRGIKIVDEARWLRIYVIATLLALGLMDLVWLGRGQQFLFAAAVVSIILGIFFSSMEQWLPIVFPAPSILENSLIAGCRIIPWEKIESINYSQWFGIRLELRDGKKISFSGVSRINARYFRRMIGELEQRGIPVPELVKAQVVAREFQMAPERRGFFQALFSIFQALLLGLTCGVFVFFVGFDLNPAFFLVILFLLQTFNLLIFFRLVHRLDTYYFRLICVTVAWFCCAGFLMKFRDQVYVAVLFSGMALVITAITLRAWFLPYLKKGFHAAALAFSIAALTGGAFGFIIMERQIQTVARIKNKTAIRKITMGRGRLLFAAQNIQLPSTTDKSFAIYSVAAGDRNVKSSAIGEGDYDMGDVSSSPDGRYFISEFKNLNSSPDSHDMTNGFFVTDTDSMQTRKLGDLHDSLPFLDGFVNDQWSPDGSRLIILPHEDIKRKPGPVTYHIYDAEAVRLIPFTASFKFYNFCFWKDRDHLVFWERTHCKTSPAGDEICSGKKYLAQNINDGSTVELYQWDEKIETSFRNCGERIEGLLLGCCELMTIDHREGKIYRVKLKDQLLCRNFTKHGNSWVNRKGDDEIIIPLPSEESSNDLLNAFAAVNYKTGDCKTFTPPRPLPMLYFHLSPDGRKIALLTSVFGAPKPPVWKLMFQFFYGSELWVYDPEAGSLHKIMDRNYQLFYWDDLAWSEDSKYLYTGTAQFPSIFDWKSRLRIVRIKVDE